MLRLGVAGRASSTTLSHSCLPCTTTLHVSPRRKSCHVRDNDGSRRYFGRMHCNVVVATVAAAAAGGAGDGYMQPAPIIVENGALIERLMPTTPTRTTPSLHNALAAASVSAPALIEENIKAATLSIKDADKDTSPAVTLSNVVASVSATSAAGQAGVDPNNYTVLQKHVAYFDRNQDGVVYLTETFEGFRALGFPLPVSALGSLFINGALSYPTYDGWIPDPRLPIYIESIHLTKHGSDSNVYDKDGNFVQFKFDEMFQKFALTKPDKLSFDEIINMTKANKDVHDVFGWTAAQFEWQITHTLAKDSEGFVSKDAIRGIYDGSFFSYIEDKLKKENRSA